jgi:two-component system, NarL family, sensor histidine kinase DesK
VSGELRELFAWTIREAITNIVRHSRARTVEIELTSTTLRISNDGVDPSTGRVSDPESNGNGLVGLRERVDALGGTMAVHHVGPQFVVEVAGP